MTNDEEDESNYTKYQFKNLHRICSINSILTSEEQKFLMLVESSNIVELKELIKTRTELSFDCCDVRGHRALDLAIKKHDKSLFEFLLQELDISTLHYYCALLSAVQEDDVDALQMLFHRISKNSKLDNGLHCIVGGGPGCIRCLPEVAVSNLTPLMVAAIEGKVEITKMFLERNYSINKPHSPCCPCKKCGENRSHTGETLTESLSRLNAYRTLASPTYLILTSHDPILTAFKLSYELEQLSCELPENQKDYKELSRQCSLFAADLLDECRTTEEVKILLSRKFGCPDTRPQKLNRFVTAVHYGQKEFVTHPNCQQVLRSIWVEGLPWYYWTRHQRMLHVLKQSLLMPIVCIAYSVAPNNKRIKVLNIPINRFIYTTVSYCTFLFLLLVTLLGDRFNGSTHALITETMVAFFIVGFFFNLPFKSWYEGCHSSWYKSYSYDFIMSILFLLSEIIFVINLTGLLGGSKQRSEMSGWDAVLLGDAVYAVASIMAYSRLVLWCKLSCHLGPLIVSLKYMLRDVLRFFVLFNIIQIAFAIGINSMYKHYESPQLCQTRENQHGRNEFKTLYQTSHNLFWAIFGKGEPHYAEIYNIQSNGTMNVDENRHYFTEAVGYGIWGMYHLVACQVILNMLIGMMADSYQRVQENADMEWKFACSTLWLSVFDSDCLVPPPYNILPSIKWFFIHLQRMTKSGRIQQAKPILKKQSQSQDEAATFKQKTEEEKYQKLMIKLIRRYSHTKSQRESSSNVVHCLCLPKKT